MGPEKLRDEESNMEHIKNLSDQRRNDLRIWGDRDRMDVDYFDMSKPERDRFDQRYDAS